MSDRRGRGGQWKRTGGNAVGLAEPRPTLRNRCALRNRGGYSLVEALVVMAIASVVVSLAGVCLHEMYRAEQRTRQGMTRRAALTALATRFRADAHDAVRAELSPPAATGAGGGIVFTLASGRTIAYRTEGPSVERTAQQDGQTVHHDAFRLPGVRIAWQLQTDGSRPLASAVITRWPEPGVRVAVAAGEERLEAAVGLRRPTIADLERPSAGKEERR